MEKWTGPCGKNTIRITAVFAQCVSFLDAFCLLSSTFIPRYKKVKTSNDKELN